MWLINQCNIFVCFSPSTISFWLIATYSHVQFILWKKYGSYQHSEFTQLRLIRIQPWTPGVMNDWTVTTRKQNMSGSHYRFVMKDFHNQQSNYDLTGGDVYISGRSMSAIDCSERVKEKLCHQLLQDLSMLLLLLKSDCECVYAATL